ncbi:thermophilic serine proteinase precursor [Clostridium homopropionicum DSM 5847]|uniref:Thermophilic serine proteinase n=1 Tax=Clostridium homopropionicum DSM 5847 TaxID=1121318 RepID=A0A0L6ZEZ1_9CLOT|nr:S8 family serine peptidase [Clostridium homopropionicum]KOA21343.1 thermophilic serine proteinase precursor [Clostridium homopropionicum DSM 5847]
MKKRRLTILSLSLSALLLIPQNVMAITQSVITTQPSTSSTVKSVAYVENNGKLQYLKQGSSSASSSSNTSVSASSSTTASGSKVTKARKSQLKGTANNSGSIQKPTSTNPKETAQDKIKNAKNKLRPTSVSNQLIIKFKNGTTDTVKNSIYSKNNLKSKKNIKALNTSLVELPKGTTVEQATKFLKANSNVESVQPNYLYYPSDATISSDPRSSELWGLENVGQAINGVSGAPDIDINAPTAWNVTKGDSNLVVGIIDTGVDYKHPDLIDKVWTNPGETPMNGVDDDNNGYIDDVHGWDFYNNDNSVFDINDGDFHGTHVAGTIAASMNDVGVVGVAPNVQIMPLKFIGPDGGDTMAAIEAINYAANMGIKITNNSWGGGGYDPLLKEAIENSNSLFVAAAGNESNNNDMYNSYPASYDSNNILSVAAVENDGTLAGFSNYGPATVDVAAPGVSILSTVPKNYDLGAAIGSSNGTYKTLYQGFGLESIAIPPLAEDYMSKVLNYFGITSGDKILLVQDDEHDAPAVFPNYFAAYKNPLDVLVPTVGFTVDTQTVGYNSAGPDAAVLNQYKLVIWFTGDGFGWSSMPFEGALRAADRTNLSNYLNQGGNLFLASKEAAFDTNSLPFINTYLHANLAYEDEGEGRPTVAGLPNTAFAGSLYPLMPSLYIDYLEPSDPIGQIVLNYPGDPDYSNAYDYYNGTSMATPHVTGVAALLLSKNLTQNPLELKSKIMKSSQFLPSLIGYVGTCGLVRADAALALADFQADDDIPGLPLPQSPVVGTLDETSDLDDVYSFNLDMGEMITFTLTGDPNTDFDLHIYDGMATTVNTAYGLLASSENIGSTESITFTATHPGVYYIDAYAYSGAGDYTLSYEKAGNIVFDDKDPLLAFIGKWTDDLSENHYKGSAKTLNSSGTMILPFTGSKVTWKGFKGPNQGIANVLIDGQNRGAVSLYSITKEFNQELFTADLPYGHHTLEIQWTGRWDKAAKRKTYTAINVDSIEVANINKPMAPQSLTTERFLNAVNIVFFIQDYNAIKFNVYRSENGVDFTKIDSRPVSAPDAHYLDRDLQDKLYYYKITTENPLGIESDFSDVVQDRPIVGNSKFTIDDSSNHITYTGAWTEENKIGAYKDKVHSTTQAGAKASLPFTGYNLGFKFYGGPGMGTVRITSSFGFFWDLDLSQYPDATSIRLYSTPRVEGDTWTIECLSGKVMFDGMDIEDLQTTPPAAPSTLKAAKDDSNVNLTWNDNSEIDVAGYNVYRSETKGAKGTQINTALVGDLKFTDSSVDATKTYYYTISAVNYAKLESGASNEVEILGQAGGGTTVTRVEETDANVKFSTGWTLDSNANNSGASAKYSNVTGSYVEFTFTGTGIKWLYLANQYRGIAKVTIDGVSENVDTYSSTTQYKKVAYTKDNLTYGQHTIKIEVTSTKNPSALGTHLHVDAFEVITTPQPTITRFEETDTNVKFSSGWTLDSNANNSGASAKYSNVTSSYVEFTFTGTGIKWLYLANQYRGLAKVTIDGVSENIDTYSSTTQYKKVAYTKDNLTYGQHTIKIEVTGTKNPSALGTHLHVDAFEVITAPQPTITRFEETDTNVKFSTGWTLDSNANNSGASAKYSNVTGSYVEFTFTGTGIKWLYLANQYRGIAKVTIDGVSENIDTYSSTTQYKKVAYTKDNLTYGQHTIKIEVTGTKNPSALGTHLHVDAFEVIQ